MMRARPHPVRKRLAMVSTRLGSPGATSRTAPTPSSGWAQAGSSGITGPRPKVSLSSASRPTSFSCQPCSPRTYWRTGKQSRNSLAMIKLSPSGTSLSVSCQCAGATPRAVRCASLRVGLVSTKCRRRAALKPGTLVQTRSISAIKVPRPGPNSIRWKGEGLPRSSQLCATHSPINSPKI